MEFSSQEYWSGLPWPLPGDHPDPGIEPASPAVQADSLPLSHQGSPIHHADCSANQTVHVVSCKEQTLKESLFNTDFTLTKLCQGRFRLQYCSAPCPNTFSWVDIEEMKTNLHAVKVLLKGWEFGTKIHWFSSGAVVKKESAMFAEVACRRCRRLRFNPWIRKLSWKRNWLPTPVLLPGKSHGQRSLVGYSPWGRKESDTT